MQGISIKADFIWQIYDKFEKGGLSKANQQTIVTLTSQEGLIDGKHDEDLENSKMCFLHSEKNSSLKVFSTKSLFKILILQPSDF